MSLILDQIGYNNPRYRLYYRWAILTVAVVLLCIALTQVNLVLVSDEGAGSSFLLPWHASRQFLAEGISPYSPQAVDGLRAFATDFPNQRAESGDSFYMPLFGIVLYFPFLFFNDFALAAAAWMTLLELSLVMIAYLSLRLVNWKTPDWIFGIFMLTVVFSFFSIDALLDGDVIILVALILLGVFYALKNNGQELAGVLLTFALVELPAMILIISFLVIWGIRFRKGKLVGWFFGTVILLSTSAALLQPDWILDSARVYFQMVQTEGLGLLPDILGIYLPGTGVRLAVIFSSLFAILLLVEWLSAKAKSFNAFYWMACLTLSIAQLLGIWLGYDNYILLMPVLVLITVAWIERWKSTGKLIALTNLLLFSGLAWLFGTRLEDLAMMFWLTIPFPLYLMINLYWIRWWLIRNPNLWFEEAYLHESPRRHGEA